MSTRSLARRVALAVFTVVLATLTGVFMVEIGWRLLKQRSTALEDYDNRYRLIGTQSHSEVFRNIDDYFLYLPNESVRTVAWYDTPAGWVTEYDYSFLTNNLGLVQATDVQPGLPSILFLGDSITEGQGAAPWFDRIHDRIAATGFQPVNAGLFGTGFEQWLRVHDHLLSAGVTVDRVVAIFIDSDDRRPLWNFPAEMLRCLSNYRVCDGSEGLFGLPDDAQQLSFVTRMSEARKSALPTDKTGLQHALRTLFPAATEAYFFVRYVLDSSYTRGNVAAIKRLIDTYGDRIIFVHVPHRWAVMHGISMDSVNVRNVIEENGGRLFDGFANCGLAVDDFHPNDGHYNERGYAKLSECVIKAVAMVSAP